MIIIKKRWEDFAPTYVEINTQAYVKANTVNKGCKPL
jgi:hypothetical protein